MRPTGESHRATTFEPFFDLVYVFAATQVTGYMAHEHSGQGVLQGLLLLALMWWTWSAMPGWGTRHGPMRVSRGRAPGVQAAHARHAEPPRLVAVAVLLAALVALETTRYAQARRNLRDA